MLAVPIVVLAIVVVENVEVAETASVPVDERVPNVPTPAVSEEAVSDPSIFELDAVNVFTFAVLVAVRDPICEVPTISFAAIREVVEVSEPTV